MPCECVTKLEVLRDTDEFCDRLAGEYANQFLHACPEMAMRAALSLITRIAHVQAVNHLMKNNLIDDHNEEPEALFSTVENMLGDHMGKSSAFLRQILREHHMHEDAKQGKGN